MHCKYVHVSVQGPIVSVRVHRWNDFCVLSHSVFACIIWVADCCCKKHAICTQHKSYIVLNTVSHTKTCYNYIVDC